MTFEIPNTVNIEPGNYPAILEKVEVDNGQFGEFRKWHWLVETKDEDGRTKIESLTQLTSANTGPQSKSYQQLTALLGEAPKAGSSVESPTGKRVLLTIGKNAKGFPQVELVSPIVEPQQTLPGIPR